MSNDAPVAVNNQQCVRVNPYHLVGPNSDAEEREVITTVSRPKSHAVFSSKQIRLLGPLPANQGGIPLREYLVGIGSRQGSSPKPVEGLPNPASTAYYTPYGDASLSAEQFEIMWQFDRFAKTGKVAGLDERTRVRILTLGDTVEAARSAFQESSRTYVYEGWTEAHFALFFEEYCAFKAAASPVDGLNNATTSKWGGVKPPRGLNEDELSRYFIDTHQRSPGSPNRLSKLDLTLDNLIAVKERTRREEAKVVIITIKRPDNIYGQRRLNRLRPGQRRQAGRPHNEPLAQRVEWPSSLSVDASRGRGERRTSRQSSRGITRNRDRNGPRHVSYSRAADCYRPSPTPRAKSRERKVSTSSSEEPIILKYN
ncbi:hypothetical protein EMPG_17079 [Blastomyces silverae]|uniref:Uncharacterized protein n=1 Tax=Blastomyces silverae TaxID=2060906 RepID=A0A0H1B8N7_9EURO|nr:hypothetical protein EMPG_17079 [Blastomyces silverae]